MTKLNEKGEIPFFVWGWLIGILVIVFIGWAINYTAHAIPNYSRNQTLLNERNQTTVNDIQIAQTAQLVKVQTQKAQIKIEEAKGIAEAQKIIANSLTNQYLQYEAIEAQKAEINGNNHTVIYIPSGANGIPFVQNLSGQ